MGRPSLRLGFFSLAFCWIGWTGRSADPALWTVDTTVAATAGSAGETSEHAEALTRLPMTSQPSGWRALLGAEAENNSFGGGQIAGTPGHLRSVAAEVGVEFWEEGETVATVRASPGEYFSGHPSSGDWDVPIDAWSGIPVPGTKSVAGALGIETARFYHHPIPIVGAVWTINAEYRVEALYPEPALVITPGPNVLVRIGGELIGGGYLARSLLIQTPVEYYAYRVGVSAQRKCGPINFSAAAGDEVEREFDFFRQRRRIHRGDRVYCELGITIAG